MFEIFTYGGGDFLRMIFTGVASIFGNSDYIVGLKAAALIGFVGVLAMAAFQRGKLDLQWLFAVIFIYLVAVVPKVDVVITDRIVAANSSIVANVPLGLGLTSTVVSNMGDWMTRSFETVFALPGQMSYTGNGLLFGSKLVQESARFEITDPRLSSNMSEFWKSCVYYDLFLNRYTWDQLIKSTNLISFFKAQTSVTRSFSYTDAGGARQILVCRTAVNGVLGVDIDAEITNAIDINGVRLVPGEATNTDAILKFASSMPVAYQYLTGLSMSSSQIMGQNVLANSLKRGLTNFASEADAGAAAQDFALARAEAERATTFNTMGELAKKMLPILQTLFEAFIYAVFPIVMMLAMLPSSGKVALGYMKALLWINLWPPLYAILHFAMTYFSQDAASSAVVLAGGAFPTGLTIMTNTALGSTMKDYAAIAGYLSLSIPMISWMMVSQSGAMMASMAGRMMEGYDKPVSKAADEATTGNIALGKSAFETQTAFATNASPSDDRGMVNQRLESGAMMSTTAAGSSYVQMQQSSGPVDIGVADTLVNGAQQELSRASSRESRESVEMASSNASVLRESESLVNQVGRDDSVSSSMSSSAQMQYAERTQDLERIVEGWAQSNGVELSDQARASLYAGVEAGGSLFGFVSAKGGSSVEGSTSEAERDSYQKALDFASSEEYSSAVSSVAEAAKHLSSVSSVSDKESLSSGVDAALVEQSVNSRQHSDAVSNVASAKEAVTQTEEFRSSVALEGLDAIKNYAAGQGMGVSAFTDLMATAAHGGEEGGRAMDEIRSMVVGSGLRDGGDAGMASREMAAIEAGVSSLNTLYNQNNNEVIASGNGSMSDIDSMAPLTARDVTVAQAETEAGVSDTLSRETEISSSRAALLDGGDRVVDTVEKARILSEESPIPGAAGVFNEGKKEAEIDDLMSKRGGDGDKK